MTDRPRRLQGWGYAAWMLIIAVFAALHAAHLRADFPNGSPWVFDWAKYTDEGWYGNAAARAHLFGNWYMAGDFNPAVAVPVWPFLEWILYFFTGVSIVAARGLAIGCFFTSLALTYWLMRASCSRPMALLAVTLVVTSPFLYCFSRLAILEPLQTVLILTALNLAVRLARAKRPIAVAAAIGVLFALNVLTKTTGAFLLPAVTWAIVIPLWDRRKMALRCAMAFGGAAAVAFAAWMALIASLGLYGDYKYYFFVNKYDKPSEFYWPLVAFWWSLHGLLWVDHSAIVMAAAMVLLAAAAMWSGWGRRLWGNPLFGCSILAVGGYVLFMTMQDHPQPRYFAVPAFFCFFLVGLGIEELLRTEGWMRRAGWTAAIAMALVIVDHGAQTERYFQHPQYTFVNAAAALTQYIDTHPNGKRLMVSISGDEITLITHLPTLCDDFGTEDLAPKIADYQPGWYAAWNDLDPGTLEDLHAHFSVEQVAGFSAFDDPDRNLLVLFKLHPLPNGEERNPGAENLKIVLPGDKIDVLIE